MNEKMHSELEDLVTLIKFWRYFRRSYHYATWGGDAIFLMIDDFIRALRYRKKEVLTELTLITLRK